MTGKLFLLPNVLDESLSSDFFLPASLGSVVETLEGLIVESEKAGRRFLRRFLTHEKMAALPLKLLNEHTTSLEDLLASLAQGGIWGLISDAGLPCIADPGSDLVWEARRRGIVVEAIAGPCSILMALQISGFSGQSFSFHGYLPRQPAELEIRLRELEQNSSLATQIWIEAPYRSSKMIELAIRTLQSNTRFCVAANLTLPSQQVLSAPISEWRNLSFPLEKSPAVFLIAKNR